MAIEPTASGQIQEFLRVFKRRRWQILLPAIFVFVLGSAFAVIVPKKYVVETRIEIRESRTEGDYLLKNPRASATAVEIQNAEQHVKHHNRIVAILEGQGRLWPSFVNASPGARGEIIRQIREDISVNVLEKDRNEGSTFVDITYRDVDAARAERFLTALTERWVEDVHARDLHSLENEKEILQEELQSVRTYFEEQNNRWVELARQMGVDPSRPPGNTTATSGFATDPSFELLNDLKRDRITADNKLQVARTDLENVTAKQLGEPEQILEQTEEAAESNATEIAALEEEILQLRTQQSRITRSHSSWRQLEREIALREDGIDQLRLLGREVAVLQEWVENPQWEWWQKRKEKAEEDISLLGAELVSLDETIDDLERKNTERIEDFAVLLSLWEARSRSEAELTNTQNDLNDKNQSLRISREAYGKPYEIAKPAQANEAATEPSAALIVAGSLLGGLALGLGLALLAEYSRNSYRTVHELSSVMGVPVLGAISVIRTRDEARRLHLRRAFVGGSSAIVLGGVSWLTWVWHAAPDKLPVEVLRAIESFRGMLS